MAAPTISPDASARPRRDRPSPLTTAPSAPKPSAEPATVTPKPSARAVSETGAPPSSGTASASTRPSATPNVTPKASEPESQAARA
ncbi:MAG: hypothetical protein OZ921_21085 [Sorangiineae bacterium]|nr:hypothetical protein [Sorangiineae bacterium]